MQKKTYVRPAMNVTRYSDVIMNSGLFVYQLDIEEWGIWSL